MGSAVEDAQRAHSLQQARASKPESEEVTR